jgi:hypothetical protein
MMKTTNTPPVDPTIEKTYKRANKLRQISSS